MNNYQSLNRCYRRHKNSEIEWLGEVPEHWNLSRIKSLTETKSGTTPKSDLDEYYENGTYFWVRTTDLNNARLYSSEFKVTDLAIKHHNLPFIKPKSILLAMYGGMGTIGKNSILEVEITINQSVCAILPNQKKINSEYLWYYIKFFRPHWAMFADSARKDPNINQEVIKRLWIALPPISEQEAIANYLDIKTVQIDRKINLLNQKANLYSELKQSLINETVTCGLDRSVPMKDSSIKWIGEVPNHWKVSRIKEIADINKRTLTEKTSNDYEFHYVDIGNITYGIKNFDSERTIFQNAPSRARRILKKGDIIISTVRTYLKAIASIDCEVSDVIASTGFAVITPKESFFAKYFSYFLTSSFIVDAICALSTGVSYPATNSSAISNLLCLVPPISEQKAIADYLDTKTVQIDRIVQTINSQIEKLKELRKTLINDVVTGKIKVIED